MGWNVRTPIAIVSLLLMSSSDSVMKAIAHVNEKRDKGIKVFFSFRMNEVATRRSVGVFRSRRLAKKVNTRMLLWNMNAWVCRSYSNNKTHFFLFFLRSSPKSGLKQHFAEWEWCWITGDFMRIKSIRRDVPLMGSVNISLSIRNELNRQTHCACRFSMDFTASAVCRNFSSQCLNSLSNGRNLDFCISLYDGVNQRMLRCISNSEISFSRFSIKFISQKFKSNFYWVKLRNSRRVYQMIFFQRICSIIS